MKKVLFSWGRLKDRKIPIHQKGNNELSYTYLYAVHGEGEHGFHLIGE